MTCCNHNCDCPARAEKRLETVEAERNAALRSYRETLVELGKVIRQRDELFAVCKKIKARGTISFTWIDDLDAAIAKVEGGAA